MQLENILLSTLMLTLSLLIIDNVPDLRESLAQLPTATEETYHLIRELGSSGSDDVQLSNFLGDIALDSNNNLYVADNGNNRVQKFDSNGNFIKKWGTLGTSDGQYVIYETGEPIIFNCNIHTFFINLIKF